ncbi:hypothetical protein PybrP1_011670 [[Pythium] brassicae (nom. inval.)]|nr:hypothetical protein PybrP1_011670 [[Pythium] brassicae (nom. inval.)]
MAVNAVVPKVVLHFHGFRLSRLNGLEDALCYIALDMLRKMMTATAACGACAVATHAACLAAPVLADGVVSGLITFATFSSCTVLAQGPARLAAPQRHYTHPSADVAAMKAAASAPTTLPLLSTRLLAPTTGAPSAKALQLPSGKGAMAALPSASLSAPAAAAAPSMTASRIPSLRRRVLGHLKRGPPIVNPVPGETRRRAQLSLLSAKIRVGKAHVQQLPGARKPQDLYMVRVDCGGSAPSEKHMNPVVMWDITATFGEFKQLEHALKREARAKKLSAAVPHLSSGAVLFVQQELNDHVLNARRARLQAFMDAVRADAELAGTDSLRKFCQAY